jgi:hypothetical protein
VPLTGARRRVRPRESDGHHFDPPPGGVKSAGQLEGSGMTGTAIGVLFLKFFPL